MRLGVFENRPRKKPPLPMDSGRATGLSIYSTSDVIDLRGRRPTNLERFVPTYLYFLTTTTRFGTMDNNKDLHVNKILKELRSRRRRRNSRF